MSSFLEKLPPDYPPDYCNYAADITYIYTSPTQYNPLLQYNNTWFRNRPCTTDDLTVHGCMEAWGRRCGSIEQLGDPNSPGCVVMFNGFRSFGDVPCNQSPYTIKALCQITGKNAKSILCLICPLAWEPLLKKTHFHHNSKKFFYPLRLFSTIPPHPVCKMCGGKGNRR